jgi:cation:H+ antiporter
MTAALPWIAAQFVLCTLVILFSGIRLSRYGDIIAHKTGLGGMWMGVVAMAVVTSLPELITGVSSILVFDVVDIAAGDVIGSCMFNLVILAFLDVRDSTPVSTRMHQSHVLAAGFGILQLGLAILAMLAGPDAPALGWIGLPSLTLLAVYVFAMRTIFTFERRRLSEVAEELTGEIRYRAITLRRALVMYGLNALLLIGAAVYLPGIAERLSAQAGLDQSFVGTLFVAIATSLPEVVVSAAAAQVGAIDMAAGNLFGSNLFNLAVLGIDDVVHTRGMLLARISPVHLVGLSASICMTAVAIIGLTYRAQRKRFRLSWDMLGILAIYVLALSLLARRG